MWILISKLKPNSNANPILNPNIIPNPNHTVTYYSNAWSYLAQIVREGFWQAYVLPSNWNPIRMLIQFLIPNPNYIFSNPVFPVICFGLIRLQFPGMIGNFYAPLKIKTQLYFNPSSNANLISIPILLVTYISKFWCDLI